MKNLKTYIATKRFIKASIANILASLFFVASTDEYKKIFILAILGAIIQAIQKWIKEMEKEGK